MKRVVDNSPAKRREMLWNSTVRGGVRSGDAPFLARFSDLCMVRGVAHSSRTRACVAEPRACRDEDPVPAVTRKAVHFNGECGCVVCNVQISLRLAAFASDRSAAHAGEREYAIVSRRGKTRSFGRRFRPTWRACPVRTRACERGQRGSVDIRSPKRLATLSISTVSVSTRSAGEPCPARIAGRSRLSLRIRHRIGECACMWISCVADHSKRCGFQR